MLPGWAGYSALSGVFVVSGVGLEVEGRARQTQGPNLAGHGEAASYEGEAVPPRLPGES